MWAGELDTLLLRWDDGWLPGLRWSSKDGAGEGLSGTRSCNPSNNKRTHTQNKYRVQRKANQHGPLIRSKYTQQHCIFVNLKLQRAVTLLTLQWVKMG